MAKLNEAEKRRPDFRGGRPVVMADGQEWSLARPRVRFVPADNDAGFEIILSGPGDGYNELIERRTALLGGGDLPADAVRRAIAVNLEIGKRLLLANYDLTTAELGQVLQYGYDDDDADGRRVLEGVLDVAYGNDAPKPSAGGGESTP
jgi:hypothetical protein